MAMFENNQRITINSGAIKGQCIDVACKAWFSSDGKIMPMMFKVKDASDEIYLINIEHICKRDEKNYEGTPCTEFVCTAKYMEKKCEVKLIYFKKDCKWVVVA